MSFALEIKNEILSQEMNKSQAISLITGIISSAGVKDSINIIIKINNNLISSHLRELLDLLNVKHEVSKLNKNWIILEEKIFDTTKIINPSYYFGGIFIGGGSISAIDSTSYHLEIQFFDLESAERTKDFLNKYSFEFIIIQRRGRVVVYLKKSEQISDFLKAIQSFNALLIFEDARISRDLKNHINRYSNLDTYNQQKLVDTTQKFLKLYDYAIQNNLLTDFRIEEIQFYEIKKKNPYSSLNDLIGLYYKKTHIQKTRSGFNHYLIKLRNKVEDHKWSKDSRVKNHVKTK